MTPKEAFKEYKQVAQWLVDGEFDNYSPYIKLGKDLLEIAPIIEQALTPPTVEEVCEALRVELKWLIIYDEKKKSFCHIDTANLREIQAIYMRDNKLYVSQPLSPSTITLIGRFYEGLEVKE